MVLIVLIGAQQIHENANDIILGILIFFGTILNYPVDLTNNRFLYLFGGKNSEN